MSDLTWTEELLSDLKQARDALTEQIELYKSRHLRNIRKLKELNEVIEKLEEIK